MPNLGEFCGENLNVFHHISVSSFAVVSTAMISSKHASNNVTFQYRNCATVAKTICSMLQSFVGSSFLSAL